MNFVRLRVLSNSRLGVRGSALLTLGLFHCLYSIQQLWPDNLWLDRGDTQWRSEHLFTSEVFGVIWAAVGIVCVISSFFRRDAAGYAGTVALFAFWAMTEIGAWADGQAPRGYLSAATWATFGILTLILSRIAEQPKITTYTATEEEVTADRLFDDKGHM